MKKLLLFITVLFFGVYSIQAQDETSYDFAQGDWVLGGGITFGNSDVSGVETSFSSIGPRVGYFITDDWALGAGVLIASMDDGGDKFSTTVVSISASNFFLDMGERTKWFYQISMNNYSGDTADFMDPYDEETGEGGWEEGESAMQISADLGMTYFMNENLLMTFGLNNLLSIWNQGDNSAFAAGWSGEINNIRTAATLSIAYKF